MHTRWSFRSSHPGHTRAIWDAMWEARRDHWGYVEPTEQDYERWTRGRLFAPELWKVAWDGEQVAGMVLNRLDREQNKKHRRQRGYTQDIFVRRPYPISHRPVDNAPLDHLPRSPKTGTMDGARPVQLGVVLIKTVPVLPPECEDHGNHHTQGNGRLTASPGSLRASR